MVVVVVVVVAVAIVFVVQERKSWEERNIKNESLCHGELCV